MKIYFLSSKPCALSLNGVYFGLTDKFERFADISLKDRVYVRFAPENALSIGFFLTEEIRFLPPEGCEVYLLDDGIAVYAKDFPPADFTLRTIAQERFENLLVTVFRQGKIQLAVQSDEGFFTDTLPDGFDVCKIALHSGLIFLEGEKLLAVYTRTGERALLEEVLSYAVENGTLRASLPLSDSLQRRADCAWELSEKGCERVEFTLRQAQESAEVPEEGLLAYAFFESVLIGGDYAALLADGLKPEAEKLAAFLGKFESVLLTRDPKRCGLIRKKAERLFEAAYFTVETEDGKITDVKG